MSFGRVVNNEAQSDQHPRAHQGQEAHHGPLDQDVAPRAGLRSGGTLLRSGALSGEAVVPDEVAIVGEGGFDDDFLVDLAVQAELWVSLVVQGVDEVTLQVDAIQDVC